MRFTPIVRVSTKDQNKGDRYSIKTQTKEIKDYVEALNGIIPEDCWKYSGQEHATRESDRAKLQQLLKDSKQGLFDAVIVCDASRWARDNELSKKGLRIFRENGIRFFLGTMEIDLFNPEQLMFLGVSVEIAEFQAMQNAQKSMRNRINKAKDGKPSTRLPYGRTWSEKDGWGVDPKKKLMINDIANRFLAGEDLTKLGQIYGMSRNYIRYILIERSGDQWQQSFKSKRLNIDVTIPTKIPPLIDDPKTIEAIKERVQLNKTIFRGPLQKSEKGRTYQKYLFSKMILCGHCKTALFGEMMNKRTRHYRHRRATEYKGQITKVGCIHFKYVQADLIEEPIMKHIYELFGDPSKIEKAIADAIPDLSETEELQQALIAQNYNLKEIDRKYDTYMDSLEEAKNKTSRSKIIKRMDDLEERHNAVRNEIKRIESRLKIIPNREEIKTKANLIKRQIKGYFKFPGDKYYEGMSFEDKRSLLQYIFKGTDPDGARLGIYISKDAKGWLYEIKGILISEIGRLIDDQGTLDRQKTTIVNKP